MSGIKAVLWDMDGTLVDSEPAHRATLAQVLNDAGHPVDEDYGDRFLGTPMEDIFLELQVTFGLTEDFPTFSDKIYRTYLSKVHRLKPRPGALEAWRTLDALGISQAVVSNADRMILGANLDAVGLSRPGRISVSINDVIAGKPDAEPYLRAAHLLGVSPAQCLVIEDSAVGALAGLRAGMRVFGWPEHDHVVFPEGVQRIPSKDVLSDIYSLLQQPLETTT